MIDTTIEALFDRFACEPPAANAAIDAAMERLGVCAVPEYRAFLEAMDGADGDAGGDFGYVQLWGAADIATLNDAYYVEDFLDHTVLIASDGIEEAYGLARRGDHVVVISVPFTPMEEKYSNVIAPTFAAFLAQVVDR